VHVLCNDPVSDLTLIQKKSFTLILVTFAYKTTLLSKCQLTTINKMYSETTKAPALCWRMLLHSWRCSPLHCRKPHLRSVNVYYIIGKIVDTGLQQAWCTGGSTTRPAGTACRKPCQPCSMANMLAAVCCSKPQASSSN